MSSMDIDMKDMNNFVPVPQGKIPLFGDCFNGVPEEEKARCTKVYRFEN